MCDKKPKLLRKKSGDRVVNIPFSEASTSTEAENAEAMVMEQEEPSCSGVTSEETMEQEEPSCSGVTSEETMEQKEPSCSGATSEETMEQEEPLCSGPTSEETMEQKEPLCSGATVSVEPSKDAETQTEEFEYMFYKPTYQAPDRQYFKSDDKVRFYTGLPSYQVLLATLKHVAPHVSRRTQTLDPFQEFVMVLMKLRLNVPF